MHERSSANNDKGLSLKTMEDYRWVEMVVSYKKLWKTLIDKEMNKTDLRIKADLGTATLAKLSKDQLVSMTVIMKICEVLGCGVDDVMEINPAEKHV